MERKWKSRKLRGRVWHHFCVTPNGVYSVLYNFDRTTGYYSQGPFFQHTNGILGTPSKAVTLPFAGGVSYSLNLGLKPLLT